MEAISVRELRNNGGHVLTRVSQLEELVVTRDGHAVATSNTPAQRLDSGADRTATAPASRRPGRVATRHRYRRRFRTMTTPAATVGMLDTSTVILLGRIDDLESLPQRCVISAITLAELSVGPLVASDPREAAARQEHVQQAEVDLEVIPFDSAAARSFAAIAASLRASGRKPRACAYDALIAATAIANGMPPYTANPKDFVATDGLTVRATSV